MTTAFLAMKNLALAGNAQVLRYLNGNVTQVGNDIVDTLPVNDTNRQASHSVCQFRGSNDLYCWVHLDIYKYDVATGDWTSVHTLATPKATADGVPVIGPLVMSVSGVPTMVVIYESTTGGTSKIVTSTDGVTWNESAELTHGISAAANPPQFQNWWSVRIVRDTVAFIRTNTLNTHPHLVVYNPVTPSVTLLPSFVSSSVTSAGVGTPDHCVFNGRHYLLGHLGAVLIQKPVLHLVSGGTYTEDPVSLDGVGNGQTAITGVGKWAVFTDGTFLYVLANFRSLVGDTTTGWHCFKLTDTGGGVLSSADITNTVIPSSIGRDSGASQTTSMRVVTDLESNPGGVPVIKLYYKADGGLSAPWDVYDWNGDSALIGNAGSPNDTGGNGTHSMAFERLGSGKLYYTEGELDIIVESIVKSIGGQIVSFRCYAAPVRLDHGAVTNGPYQVGETVTGGTSGASGEVVGVGTGHILVKNVSSGPFVNAEVVTGGTSTAFATTSAGPSGGPETVNVDFYFNDENEAPQATATLSAPSAGSLVGNQIQGLTADYDGTTLYTVKWNTVADGLSNGDRAVLMGRVSI